MRHDRDDPELVRPPTREEQLIGTMFERPPGVLEKPPGIEVGLAALAQTSAKNAAMLERLVPVAQELASEHRADGITVADVRKEAVGRGILTGYEEKSELCYLGSLMKQAGLHSRGTTRRSTLTAGHGKIQVVWFLDAG
jgi:hypothetical protein